jgi:tetratricopeptide (TPR) repeat protein
MEMERMASGIQSFSIGGSTRGDKVAIFSTFNPSAMSAELIEGTFVQREGLAERLVDVFEESACRESKHNVLLVGPRGIGKSNLVSLVYHRLKAKKDLTDKLCIAYLREDEWGINSFLDLLLRTLRSAVEEIGSEPPDAISDLSGLTRAQAEDHVWRRIHDILGDRTLLLIVENLDSVFEKIEEQGQRQLRALMQTNPQWAVLATTPALFSAISRQISPFYGFFEVIHLQPLSLTDAISLLQRLARWNNDEKTAAFLDTAVGRARVRAVQHLAGGNHRIFVLFYDFLNQSGSEHFVSPLLKTIDALTPYYQSQMVRLSPQQQKIVNFLCEHRKPATVTAIANNCLTTHQTAASQLKQLLTHRYVRVDRLGRESFYELTEPLLRICVEAKTHRERPLDLLVDFIRYWFSRKELEDRLSDTSGRDPEKPYFLAALKEYDAQGAHEHLSSEIANLCVALSLRTGPPERLRTQAQELAELSKIAEDWTHYSRAMIWLERGLETIPILEEAIGRDPHNVDILRSLANAHGNAGSKERALELLDRAIALSPNQGVLYVDKGQLLRSANQSEAALVTFAQAVNIDRVLEPFVATEKALVLLNLKQFGAAREALTPFLSNGEKIPGIFYLNALALANEEKLTEALECFDKAVRAFANDSNAWGYKGILLHNMERYEEALEALNRSLTLDPKNTQFLYYRCEALLKTRQYETALETVTPEDLSHTIFHRLLDIMNSHPKQGQLQQKLLELKNTHDSEAWQNAFLGGLTEMGSLAADFKEPDDIADLLIWNSTLKELFANQKHFSILLNLFDVLTRIKALNDRKALLELPREQRLLLVGEKDEEDFLNPPEGRD